MSLRVQFPSDQQAYDSVLGGDKGSLNPHPILRIAADGLGKMHSARVARCIRIALPRSAASCTEALVLFFSIKAKGTAEPSLCFGGDKGSRTPDLLNAIQALSQLSYTPKIECRFLQR